LGWGDSDGNGDGNGYVDCYGHGYGSGYSYGYDDGQCMSMECNGAGVTKKGEAAFYSSVGKACMQRMQTLSLTLNLKITPLLKITLML
jgi:hypothetical protein